ncbi:MAG: hypothetical protein LCH30_03040 [Proteobacteria bacterium]|nr:hypothetical protein [Pseudomonadota bacterium]
MLIEAHAAVEKPFYNPTAQYRNLLGFFGVETNISVSNTQNHLYESQKELNNSFHFSHISDIGFRNWERKFFCMNVDNESHDFVTKTVVTKAVARKVIGPEETPESEWDLLNDSHLKFLLEAIKKEATYENSLAYDLFCSASFCALGLLALSGEFFLPVSIPVAILLNIIIWSISLPICLTVKIIEEGIVNPIKGLIRICMPDEHKQFIAEVEALKFEFLPHEEQTSADNTSASL